MKVIFFGTPDFAAAILEHIVCSSKHEVVAVVSKPDAPKGRHLLMQAPPVKSVAQRLIPNVPLFQMPKVSTPDAVEALKSIQADVYWVVAYGEILKQSILDLPKKGCFNVHGSLLPQYRGAAPIQRALMDGCKKTGISIFRMARGMDSGDIIWQTAISVSPEVNAEELTRELLRIAKEGTITCLDAIEKNAIQYVSQRHEEATFAPKIRQEDRQLNRSADVIDLHNRIRALSPHPGAYFSVLYKDCPLTLKVLKTHVIDELQSVVRCFAELGEEGKLGLQTPEGTLVLDLVQLPGGGVVASDEFLRGHPLREIVFL